MPPKVSGKGRKKAAVKELESVNDRDQGMPDVKEVVLANGDGHLNDDVPSKRAERKMAKVVVETREGKNARQQSADPVLNDQTLEEFTKEIALKSSAKARGGRNVRQPSTNANPNDLSLDKKTKEIASVSGTKTRRGRNARQQSGEAGPNNLLLEKEPKTKGTLKKTRGGQNAKELLGAVGQEEDPPEELSHEQGTSGEVETHHQGAEAPQSIARKPEEGSSRGQKRKHIQTENLYSKVSETRFLKVSLLRQKSVDKMVLEEMKVKQAVGSSNGKRGRAEDGDAERQRKVPKPSTSRVPKREKIPDVTRLDFGNESKSGKGDPWNLKIASWNINGLRAWLEKDGLSYLTKEQPDVMCLQETKCSEDKIPEEAHAQGYHCYYLPGDKEGYSGVGLLSKKKPLSVDYGIGMEKHDSEGRVITAEYDDFYLVAAYVPNSGRGLVRLEYRKEWDVDFRAYLKKLDQTKPVILCGDLNVAHQEIDLANPKTNKKNAGFTQEERDGFSALLSEGFIDTYRRFYPHTTGAYTFWTYMMNARANNKGWRLDYFVTSERFADSLCDCSIRKEVMGSDHCPLVLFLCV